MGQNVEIFFCYAREDEELCKCLEKQLRILRRQGLVDIWHDRQIDAGTEWKSEIDKHLNTAQIILLLISPDFMDSDYCYSIEMTRAMDRHQRGEAHVIPVILRSTLWEGAPFGKLQALPTDAIPVVSGKWHNQDEAFKDVTEGICRVVNNFLGLASPDIPALPVVRSNWQYQLTSSPEWQQLSQEASEALLCGWQQLSPQGRTRLLQDWQQQYQEMEQKREAQANNSPPSGNGTKNGSDVKEFVLGIQYNAQPQYGLRDRLQKRTSPVVGSDKQSLQRPATSPQSMTTFDQRYQRVDQQYNADSITINQDADSPRPFTLLELEQIMERVQNQTISDKKLKWLSTFISGVILVIFLIIYVKTNWLPPYLTFTSISLAAVITWLIYKFIVIPKQNIFIQSYTNNCIQTRKELENLKKLLKPR